MSSVHSISRSRSRGADRVLVVGAGVSGLTTALSLARAGVEVEVVAERFESDLVSVVAGALWEWRPAVCGHHRDETSVHRSKTWATIVHNYGHGGSGFSFLGVRARGHRDRARRHGNAARRVTGWVSGTTDGRLQERT